MSDNSDIPKSMMKQFEKSSKYVEDYFKLINWETSRGVFDISGERYVLIRANSLSVDFFEFIDDVYEGSREEAFDFASQFLYDMGHAIGKLDARKFHERMNVKDPIEKFSAGPIIFSYMGWGKVKFLPGGRLVANKNFKIIFEHDMNFESEEWKRNKKKSRFPVCVMNSGYASGWTEESFGIPLVAVEIACKAKGDKSCRFIMGHPDKIEGYLKEYLEKKPRLRGKIKYKIPMFFKRRILADKLDKSVNRFNEIAKVVQGWIWEIDTKGVYTYSSPMVEKLLGYKSTEIVGKMVFYDLFPKNKKAALKKEAFGLVNGKKAAVNFLNELVCKNGKIITVETNGLPILDENGELIGYRGMDIDVTAREKTRKKLEERKDELEKFYNVTVGREMKMVELKKHIKELEEKLKDAKRRS